MITVESKNGIKATVLAHSVSEAGIELITYECEYPRIIHSEIMTHRMLSRNAASSRAIPFAKMVEQLNGVPVRFGANQAGMQDRGSDHTVPVMCFENLEYDVPYSPTDAWNKAKGLAVGMAKAFAEAGYHKQITGRLTEPFQMMKTVISGTEWANFFWLRDDEAADPTLRELARVMREAKEQSTPAVLKAGEWHLPCIDIAYDVSGVRRYYITDENFNATMLSLEDAIKVSCARCAAVSYRNEGYDLAKSLEVYDRLVGDDRKHASAFEHAATPMAGHVFEHGFSEDWELNNPSNPATWEEGVTHMDRDGNLWSGNIRGYIQYRKLIKGENYIGA